MAPPCKNWHPPAGGGQKFTGGGKKISARFARHLAPPWPKLWNRPWQEPSETTGNYMKNVGKSLKNIFGSAMEIIACAHVFIQCESVKIYLHLPETIIARRKDFLEAPYPIFVIVKVYHFQSPGSKKSKFDLTLNRHSPFNIMLWDWYINSNLI